VKVELLYWSDCPSYPEAQALLEQVIAGRGLDAGVQLREVATEEEARMLASRVRRPFE